jgi:hypothetical protein
VGRDEFVGRVRLPAFEHFNAEGSFKARHVGNQPTLKDWDIKDMHAGDGACAYEMIKLAHGNYRCE